MAGLEAMLGSMAGDDPDALAALLENPAAMMGMMGGLGGLDGPGGLGAGAGGIPGLGRATQPSQFAPVSRRSGGATSELSEEELQRVRPGDHVCVILGKSSGNLRGGMEAVVHENDSRGKRMLVQIEGESEPMRIAYKNLARLGASDASPSAARGVATGPGPGPTAPAPVAAAGASLAPGLAALATMQEGHRVRVVAGRNFDKFRGGMVGTIQRNNSEGRNMLVQFDDVAVSGPEPVQVAYRNLEPV